MSFGKKESLSGGGGHVNKWLKGHSVLVTGASGFIGGALTTKLLAMGARVYVFSLTVDMKRPLFGGANRGERPLAFDVEKVIHGDLKRIEDCVHAVAVSEPDYIFHLGATTQVTEAAQSPVETFQVNALGTMNILESVRRTRTDIHDTRIVVASSDKAYGDPPPEDIPLYEDDHLRPVHPYDLSKACADLVARSYARYYGLRVQVTRLVNVYGPGDTNWKRLIPGMIRWVIQGNTPVIRSDGKQVRQYLYIDDAVDAYLALALKMGTEPTLENGQAFNFAPEKKHSVMDIFIEILKVGNARGFTAAEPTILDEAKDETPALALDYFQAREQLDWKPEIDLAVGLTNTFWWAERFLGARKVILG